MRIASTSWSLEKAPKWRHRFDPECLTLELSDEGARQLSSAAKDDGNVSADDLFDFAGEPAQQWGDPHEAACGQFNGIVYSYVAEEGWHWRRWYLRNGSTILLVTYNGTESAMRSEQADVETMLCSLRPESAGA